MTDSTAHILCEITEVALDGWGKRVLRTYRVSGMNSGGIFKSVCFLALLSWKCKINSSAAAPSRTELKNFAFSSALVDTVNIHSQKTICPKNSLSPSFPVRATREFSGVEVPCSPFHRSLLAKDSRALAGSTLRQLFSWYQRVLGIKGLLVFRR